MMEKLLFPYLTGKWKIDIQLNKYAKVLQEDAENNPFLDPNLFGEWINLLHKSLGVDYSWGGYLEDREEILDGTYLPAGSKVHLGIDYWVPLNSPVLMPKDGKLVASRYDPDKNGGWGGQAIFDIDGLFYIFGHLHGHAGKVGKTYARGQVIGYVADIDRSGGWYPHLHLQCMKQFNPNVDGYGYPTADLHEEFPDPTASFLDI